MSPTKFCAHRELIRNITKINPKSNLNEFVKQWLEGEKTFIPNGLEGVAIIRVLAQHLLDYGYDISRKKFPFTRPYLELYRRCKKTFALLDSELNANKHIGKPRLFLKKFHSILNPIIKSEEFKSIAKSIEEKAGIFDRFRDTMRLASEGGYISKAGEIEPNPLTLVEMEDDLNTLITEFQQKRSIMNGNEQKAVDIILTHMKEHGEFLWGHRIEMVNINNDSVVRYAYRTNNCLECFFRPIKKNIRRRSGCQDAGYSMEHVSSAICYVRNLLSQEYLDIVYDGSLSNLPKKFALFDSQNRLPNKSDVTYTPIKGSLPAADKRIIRSKKFTEKLG
jgi:hypothetical protein